MATLYFINTPKPNYATLIAMAQITLLRHGQASFGSDNYDRLSKLGQQQSYWLGEHYKTLDQGFDRIVMGTMLRHRQTAESLLQGLNQNIELETHAGFNEYNFNGLLIPLKEQHPQLWMHTGHERRDYFNNMKQALNFWMDGTIPTDGKDNWSQFCERISTAFHVSYQPLAKRTLIVSSGGPIAVILAQLLKLNNSSTCDLILQIKNSSTSKLLYNRKDFCLDNFNDVSHLLTAEKHQSITFS